MNTIQDCIQQVPLVFHLYKMKATPEEVIVALCNRQVTMLDRIAELEAICPKKIKASDGRIFVMRVPDELIPLTQ
jgi:hypothetical protein